MTTSGHRETTTFFISGPLAIAYVMCRFSLTLGLRIHFWYQ